MDGQLRRVRLAALLGNAAMSLSVQVLEGRYVFVSLAYPSRRGIAELSELTR